MNNREKLLACIVGLLVLLMASGYTVIRVSNALRERSKEVAKFEKEVRDKKLIIDYSVQDQEQIDAYRAQALPSELEEARTLYKAWLVDCANQVGLEDPKVTLPPTRSKSKAYDAFAISIAGRGNFEQAIEFLHRFYSVDCLHRVYGFTAKRIADSKQRDLTISVEALSLEDATNTNTLPDGQSNRLAHGDLKEYIETILYRNYHGPPNNEPTLETDDEISAQAGSTVEIAMKGEDDDKLDTLKYTIDGDGLPGARLDDESGRFEWLPEKPGEYRITFKATDDGWPPKSVSQTVTINVTEAAPEEPEPEDLPSFEKAKFAYVTGLTEARGEKLAWINLRTEGKVLKLREGDVFVVDEVQVTVRRITDKTVELEATALKKRLLVTTGQNLAEGNVLPSEEG